MASVAAVEQSPQKNHTSAASSSSADEAGSNGKPEAGTLVAAAAHGGSSGKPEPRSDSNSELVDLRKYLLLLAILVATVTYVAGLNPPGGVWLDTQDGHLTGNQILVVTHHARYNAFSYCNATAFMASAVVILLLIFAINNKEKDTTTITTTTTNNNNNNNNSSTIKDNDDKDMEKDTTITTITITTTTTTTNNNNSWFFTLRVVMVLDLLALVIAYAAGASRDTVTTVVSSVLVSPIFIYVLLHMLMDSKISRFLSGVDCVSGYDQGAPNGLDKKEHGILMLLSIFVVTITYTAGLNPPGGFWPDTEDGRHGHRAGDPVLNDHHWRRFTAFFVCNTVSFLVSLAAIMLLLTYNFAYNLIKKLNLRFFKEDSTKLLPQVFIWISLLALVVAFATGSCRAKDSTTGVLATYLFALIMLVLIYYAYWKRSNKGHELHGTKNEPPEGLLLVMKKGRSLLLLLTTLVATVTYQAGLNPPGGFWPDDRDGHQGGDPIMLTKHAKRYRLFFYCNSMAFVTSLVIIFMVQRNYLNPTSKNLKLPRACEFHSLAQLAIVMVLDLIGLIGAFAAGSCRDVNTSIHVIALAGGTLVYVVFHLVFFTMHRRHDEVHKVCDAVEKKRKLLLLIIILAVTLTYQAGLTPPGGFWLDDNDNHHQAGDPVLRSNYPRRYTAFFYLNATGFMASVALTILLVNPNLYTAGINCHALFVCMVAGLFGLMGAYAAGSSRHVRTSIYMIVLIGVVFIFVTMARLIFSEKCKALFCYIQKQWERLTGSKSDKSQNPTHSPNKDDVSQSQSSASSQANKDVYTSSSISASNEASNTTSSTEEVASPSSASNEANNKEVSLSLSSASDNEASDTESNTASAHAGNIGLPAQRKYLTLLGILAASVTYQAGLAPPGGVWPDNNDGHAVGDPILRDSNHLRYRVFFYFNSVSFVASVVVITLQLLVVFLTSSSPEKNKWNSKAWFLIEAAHAITVVDLLGLLGAYAAGSSREWETSGYIVALVAAVASYIGIHLIVSFVYLAKKTDNKNDVNHTSGASRCC